MAEPINKSDLKDIAENTTNPVIKAMAEEKIKEEFKGDEVAQKMIQLSQIISGMQLQNPNKNAVNVEEVKEIVKTVIENDKIKFNDLDRTVRNLIESKPTTISLTVKTAQGVKNVKVKSDGMLGTPLFQKIFSDFLARNNVYLYGGAGTGKTVSAKKIAQFLDYDLITINCSQFTSELQILGGQTIDGYQEGKAIQAFANINADGSKRNKGCLLLLDELPKIDPNTAGLLNSVLAKVGEFYNGEPATIENNRGEVFERGEIFIMATGNSKLNEKDEDYEANFKQDLSLQDRFVGSTYKVEVNEKAEWEFILEKRWAFIFIYLTKLRKAIFEKGYDNRAFVSVRLMLSVQKTYNVYRSIIDQTSTKKTFTPDPKISYTPVPNEKGYAVVNKGGVKTIKDALDEFFSLFTEEQREELKNTTQYDVFLDTVKDKDKFDLDPSIMNTQQELEQVDEIINQ